MNPKTAGRVALEQWLHARLTEGERPEQEWRVLLDDSWEHLLDTPIDSWLDEAALHRLADRLLDAELVQTFVRPLVAAYAKAAIDAMKKDRAALDRFVPQPTRKALREALARPGLIHPDWVRAIFRGEAAEVVLNDTLYRALRDFSTLMPRLMIKLSPVGRFAKIGGAGAIAGKVVDELEKLIEPEIKSFLTSGTQRMLDRTAEFTIAKLEDPASVEFRRDIADFILAKSPAFHVAPVDDAFFSDIEEIASQIAAHVVEMEEVQTRVDEEIRQIVDSVRGKSLRELFESWGVKTRPPMDAWADATWPLLRTLLSGPEARRWTSALLGEILEQAALMDPSDA